MEPEYRPAPRGSASSTFSGRKYPGRASLPELRLVLAHVRERAYGPNKLAIDLGISERGVRPWNTRGVPDYITALSLALAKLSPQQLHEWREELKFFRGGPRRA